MSHTELGDIHSLFFTFFAIREWKNFGLLPTSVEQKWTSFRSWKLIVPDREKLPHLRCAFEMVARVVSAVKL